MRTLKRRISKMKVLNNNAILKIVVADRLYEDKDLSLSDAVTTIPIDITQNLLNEISHSRLRNLYESATKISNILDTFDEDRFKTIYARRKAGFSTYDFLEN